MNAAGATENRGDRRDRYVVLAALILMTALIYSLYLDRHRRLEAGDAQLVGEMVHHSGLIRRRYADRTLWESASTGDSLYDRNLIHTGQDSASHLRLSDGTRIELGPQTLIVLHLRPSPERNGPAIELRKGSIRVHRLRPKSAYAGELIVEHGDRSAGLESGSVNFQSVTALSRNGVLETTMRVHPELGITQLYEDGRPVGSVGPAEQALLFSGESRTRRPALQLLHPPPDALLTTAEAKLNVTLLWKQRDTPTRGGELKIAKDANLTNIVHRRSLNSTALNDGRADAGLPPGSYFWTVTGDEGEDGIVSSFRIQDNRDAPLVNLPPQRVDAERTLFSWERDPQALYYRLEVFARDGRPVLSKKIQGNFAVLPLSAGEYSYRVGSRRSAPSGEAGRQGEMIAFRRLDDGAVVVRDEQSVQTIAAVHQERPRVAAKPESLQLLYPYDGAVVDMADVDVVAFHWNRGRADGLVFRLFDVSDGRRLLHEETVRGNRLNFQELRKLTNGGSYEWELEDYGSARFRISLSVQPDRPEFVRGSTEAEP